MLKWVGTFSAIETGDVWFDDNDNLDSLYGFENHLSGALIVENHAKITSIRGWQNISSGIGLSISSNPVPAGQLHSRRTRFSRYCVVQNHHNGTVVHVDFSHSLLYLTSLGRHDWIPNPLRRAAPPFQLT